MKHEVKDEKAGSGFVNDVEKGDDFVAYWCRNSEGWWSKWWRGEANFYQTVWFQRWRSLSKGDTADNRVVQDKMVSKEDTSNDNQVSLEMSIGGGD
jgi:hypothetical protein